MSEANISDPPSAAPKRVVVRAHASGWHEIHIEIGAQVDVFMVDERQPHDRVYRMTPDADAEAIDAILGNDEIGHAGDSRHAAIENKINAFIEGRRPFAIVEATTASVGQPEGELEPAPIERTLTIVSGESQILRRVNAGRRDGSTVYHIDTLDGLFRAGFNPATPWVFETSSVDLEPEIMAFGTEAEARAVQRWNRAQNGFDPDSGEPVYAAEGEDSFEDDEPEE